MPLHDPTPYIIGGGIVVFAIIAFVILFTTIFWIVELIDAVRRDFSDPNMKVIWVLVIMFSHVIGALVYYFAGKQQGTLRQY